MVTTSPLVTIILVNYNSGPMLLKSVEAILDSSTPTKIIISDNASSDNSLHLLEEKYPNFPSIFIQKNNANLGFSAANNCVYSRVDTPFILYLNPDCFLEKNTLEQLLNVMDNYPEAALVGPLIRNQDGSEQQGCRGLTPTPWRILCQTFRLAKWFPNKPHFHGYLLSDNPLPKTPIFVELISGSCMLIRKQAIDEVGLLDERYFLYCEDYDWFYRFIQKGWKIIFTPHTSVTHLKGYSGRNIPLRILWYKTKGMWRYHDKFFKNNFLSYSLIKLAIILRFIGLSQKALLKKITLFRLW